MLYLNSISESLLVMVVAIVVIILAAAQVVSLGKSAVRAIRSWRNRYEARRNERELEEGRRTFEAEVRHLKMVAKAAGLKFEEESTEEPKVEVVVAEEPKVVEEPTEEADSTEESVSEEVVTEEPKAEAPIVPMTPKKTAEPKAPKTPKADGEKKTSVKVSSPEVDALRAKFNAAKNAWNADKENADLKDAYYKAKSAFSKAYDSLKKAQNGEAPKAEPKAESNPAPKAESKKTPKTTKAEEPKAEAKAEEKAEPKKSKSEEKAEVVADIINRIGTALAKVEGVEIEKLEGCPRKVVSCYKTAEGKLYANTTSEKGAKSFPVLENSFISLAKVIAIQEYIIKNGVIDIMEEPKVAAAVKAEEAKAKLANKAQVVEEISKLMGKKRYDMQADQQIKVKKGIVTIDTLEKLNGDIFVRCHANGKDMGFNLVGDSRTSAQLCNDILTVLKDDKAYNAKTKKA